MRRQEKLSYLFFIALLPITTIALVWSVSGLLAGTLSSALIFITIVLVSVFSHFRIQLPRTKLHLTVSDTLVVFTLIVFGGELAVLLAFVGSAFMAIALTRPDSRTNFQTSLTNISISIVTVFITAAVSTSVFYIPGSTLEILNSVYFIVLIGLLTLLPFAVNSCLVSALLAINGNRRFIHVWTVHSFDAILIYFGTALLAGLCVVALNETNAFLIVTVVGFLAILQLVFSRYVHEQEKTRASAKRSERERAELAEKHVIELEHIVGELEKSGEALAVSRERFRHAAYHDSLTDLPNRNKFVELIEDYMARARSDPDYRFALLYLDLHNFKTVNDSLGHSMGDLLIAQVGQRLSKIVSANGHVGRFGGDEFAILLSGISNTDEITTFAKRVVSGIAEPYVLNGHQVFTKASTGIAIGDSRYKNAEDIIRDADMAMYLAKEKKRNYVVFANELLARAKSNLQLETDLRLAVDRDEFELYYQPIIDLEYSQLAGFEVLVRWNHPKYGLIAPDRFIPVSEATGLIVPMTLQILEKACAQLVVWQSELGRVQPIFVSANISGTHFENPKLVEHIKYILVKTQIDPRCLKLEITETVVMENAANAISMLQQIKDLGVQLSIDDFGTGYSSLSYLQRFPIDTLKIDRAFVRTMEDGRQNGEIVKAVLALAAALKLTVVAEGIESIHQLHQLKILNCQFGQGYLFSPPVPAEEFELLLEDRGRWQSLAAGNDFAIVSPLTHSLEARIQ